MTRDDSLDSSEPQHREAMRAIDAANSLREKRARQVDGSQHARDTEERIAKKEARACALLGSATLEEAGWKLTKRSGKGRQWKIWTRAETDLPPLG